VQEWTSEGFFGESYKLCEKVF